MNAAVAGPVHRRMPGLAQEVPDIFGGQLLSKVITQEFPEPGDHIIR